MAYAWIIDKDHLYGPGGEFEQDNDDVGVCGPSQARDEHIKALQDKKYPADAEVFTFRMYDGDGMLYYTGRMLTTEGDTERACFGPLDDFGKGNAGCTDIRYPGHPEMDCG